MNTPSTTDSVTPCPWCRGTSVSVREGTTFRWRVAECDGCGASTGEVRHNTTNPDREQAARDSHALAMAEWNRRPVWEGEWAPIETAPRDGSPVLVYVPRQDPYAQTVLEASWRIPFEAAPASKGWWQTSRGTMLSADVHKASGAGTGLGATHWRPLPAGPASTREGNAP